LGKGLNICNIRVNFAVRGSADCESLLGVEGICFEKSHNSMGRRLLFKSAALGPKAVAETKETPWVASSKIDLTTEN
jgi:hypothetical protein